MNNKFNLKEIKFDLKNAENNTYTLNFSDGETEKNILLSGTGQLKEGLKI